MRRQPMKLETLADHLTFLGHDIDFEPLTNCTPTQTWPGTQARVEEYRRRVLAGQPVFHPLDATFEGCRKDLFIGHNRGKPLPGRPKTVRFVDQGRVFRKSL